MVMLNGDILLDLDIVNRPHDCHAVTHTLHTHIYEFLMLQLDEHFSIDLVLCKPCQCASPGDGRKLYLPMKASAYWSSPRLETNSAVSSGDQLVISPAGEGYGTPILW